MTVHPNPRSRLRDANPVRPEDAPSADSPHARALAARIVATPVTPTREAKRRFQRGPTFKILVPVVALALAAASYSLSRAVSDPLTVACYEKMSLQATVQGLDASSEDPVAACRALWRPGRVFNLTGVERTPDLMACLKNGALAVFPSENTDACDDLALEHPEHTSLVPEAQQAQALERRVADYLRERCLPRSDAIEYVTRQLKAAGLDDWRVDADAFPQDQPCASPSFMFATRIVFLAPVPRVSP